jgi:hypothetical protein
MSTKGTPLSSQLMHTAQLVDRLQGELAIERAKVAELELEVISAKPTVSHALYQRDEAYSECKRLREQRDQLTKLLIRYRNDTPLGHQPHMIAAEVDAALAALEVIK